MQAEHSNKNFDYDESFVLWTGDIFFNVGVS